MFKVISAMFAFVFSNITWASDASRVLGTTAPPPPPSSSLEQPLARAFECGARIDRVKGDKL